MENNPVKKDGIEYYENAKIKLKKIYKNKKLIKVMTYTQDGEIGAEYALESGAITSAEQYSYSYVGNGKNKLPASYLHIYENTPNKIVFNSISGDKSQSKTHIEITAEKTTLLKSGSSKNIQNRQKETPWELWAELTGKFNYKKFKNLKSGPSETEYDGTDNTFTVTVNGKILSVTNYYGNELKEFFDLVRRQNN